jgi:hypothetical protein
LPDDLYTLKQAKQVLATQECAIHGHSWDIIEKQMEAIPVCILCSRCGVSFNIDPESIQVPKTLVFG